MRGVFNYGIRRKNPKFPWDWDDEEETVETQILEKNAEVTTICEGCKSEDYCNQFGCMERLINLLNENRKAIQMQKEAEEEVMAILADTEVEDRFNIIPDPLEDYQYELEFENFLEIVTNYNNSLIKLSENDDDFEVDRFSLYYLDDENVTCLIYKHGLTLQYIPQNKVTLVIDFFNKFFTKKLGRRKLRARRLYMKVRWHSRFKFTRNSLFKGSLTQTARLRRKVRKIPKPRYKRRKSMQKQEKPYKTVRGRKVNVVNFSKKLNLKSVLPKTNVPRTGFPIKRRVYLQQKRIRRLLWTFLYKRNKTNFLFRDLSILKYVRRAHNNHYRSKNIFLNIHKALIWKMRTARYAHWGLRTFGKLNEYRYHKLLGYELRETERFFLANILGCLLLALFTFSLSWRHIVRVLDHKLFLVNGEFGSRFTKLEAGDLCELPSGIAFAKKRCHTKRAEYRVVKRAKRISYKSYLRFVRKIKTIYVSKQIPKIFKRLPAGLRQFEKTFAFDPVTNTVCVLREIKQDENLLTSKLITTSVLSLYNWRYRFD